MIRGSTRAALMVVAAMLAATPSIAQAPSPADAPLMGSEAAPGDAPVLQPAQTPADMPPGFGGADNLYRLLVIGDGLAGGFGAGLTRMVEDDSRFEVVNRFNEASGLARPELYDWSDAAPKILAARPYDAVLIHVGVNDRQAIRTEGKRLAFRTPEWEAAYRKRIDALLDALKAAGVKVYWVALPPMADSDFDADMQYLNGLYRAAVAEKGGVFLDERRKFLAADGSYADRGPDDTGEERKLRSRDGITFLKQGNSRMGQLLAAAIIAAETQGTAAAPVVVAAPVAATPVQPAGVPQFGQQGLDGQELAFTPSAIPAKPQQSATPAAAAPAEARPEIVAPAGSKAETLFVRGISPEPEPGRFDDFSVVAVP